MQAKTRTAWTFAITSIALFMVVLDNLVVSTALPVIRTDLDATIEQLEWTVNAYTLTFAVFLLTGAALGDRFGRRRMFIFGLGLFTAASAAAALAPSMEALIAARAVQGIGGAIVTPLTLTLLSAAFPSEKRGVALGAWSGIAGLAVAAGPLVGGAVVDGIAWQWIFWLNVPIGLAVLPLARLLTESHGPDKGLDLPGLGLASGGLLGLVWGLVHGNADGWSSPQIVGSLVAGVVLLAAFVAWEARAKQPMLPLRFFREPGVLGRERRLARDVLRHVRLDLPALAVLPDRAGLLALRGRPAGAAVDGDADDRRADRGCALRPDRRPAVPRRRPRAAGDRARAGSRRCRRRTCPTRRSIGPFIVSGIGMGMFFAPVANIVLSAVGVRDEGKASGASNAIREVGGVFGVAVLASIFARVGGYESPAIFTEGLVAATWVGAAVVGVGALVALAVPGKQRAEAPVAALESA